MPPSSNERCVGCAVAVVGGGTGHGEKMVEGPDVNKNFFIEQVCYICIRGGQGLSYNVYRSH